MKVKRDHKRRADEIAEKGRVTAMQVKRQEGMTAEAVEEIKEKEMPVKYVQN